MKLTARLTANTILTAAAMVLGMANGLVNAQTTSPAPAAAAQPASSSADMVDAEVRRIDKEGGRVTFKHAEIKSLDMPPMTMVFQVKNKAALERLKVGDKVRIKAAKEDGKYVVTEIEAAP